ncbi:unnamed protein product [Pleuronectes platessa]|uniref:Uncharacterized protein n=1 Tax=Pleuronectes platessa TaxID=8262 RepID=A0A9N7ZDT3_PLEPL|nr:unnamed protein product [Pleuronectes platessa]
MAPPVPEPPAVQLGPRYNIPVCPAPETNDSSQSFTPLPVGGFSILSSTPGASQRTLVFQVVEATELPLHCSPSIVPHGDPSRLKEEVSRCFSTCHGDSGDPRCCPDAGPVLSSPRLRAIVLGLHSVRGSMGPQQLPWSQCNQHRPHYLLTGRGRHSIESRLQQLAFVPY